MVTDGGKDSDEQSNGGSDRSYTSDRWNERETDTSPNEDRHHDSESDPLSDRTKCTRDDWEELASDPNTEADFGYRITEWNSFETPDNSSQVMFLPTEESLLKEDAFVVAEESDICELGERC